MHGRKWQNSVVVKVSIYDMVGQWASYALTVTWSSAMINGPHDIVVLSFQCKCAWALGKLYVKSIAERGIKVWKPSLAWLLSATGNGVYMMQSVSSSQLCNLKSMCYFKCNETVFLFYWDLNFSKFVYISQNIIQSWTCNRQRFVCIPYKRNAPQDTCWMWFRQCQQWCINFIFGRVNVLFLGYVWN